MGKGDPESSLESSEGKGGSSDPLRTYARFAAVWCLVEESEPSGNEEEASRPRLPSAREVVSSIATELNADPRVKAVDTPDAAYAGFRLVFPELQFGPLDAIEPLERLMRYGVEFAPPITFRVSVPEKNQPGWAGRDASVASDEYLCAWDGIVLVVMWQGTARPPLYGGQVVRDLLASAIEKAGYDSRIQGPSMAHVDVRVLHDADAEAVTGEQVDWAQVNVVLPVADLDLDSTLQELFGLTLFQAREYYALENAREAFFLTKQHLDDGVEMLLRLQHRRAAARVHPLWSRIKETWRLRTTRTGQRELVARIILETALIRSIEVRCKSLRSDYRDATTDAGLAVIFDPWVDRLMAEIELEDLTAGLVAAEHVAHRLDNRDVVLASLWGVLAGALLGVAATLIAGA